METEESNNLKRKKIKEDENTSKQLRNQLDIVHFDMEIWCRGHLC